MAEARGGRGRSLRGLWLGAALAAPLVALPLATRALADSLAERGEAGHLDAIRPVPAAPAPADPPPLPPDDPGAQPELFDGVSSPARDRDRRRASVAAERAPAPAPKGLRIRAGAVLRAARSGARPSGVPVPASGARPAGLLLQGVGQFGVGLRDGDVLTSVAGAPASSVGAVVAAVTGAWRAEARVLSAVVWRGDQPIQVAVELPRSG